jgi:hypothetical protein
MMSTGTHTTRTKCKIAHRTALPPQPANAPQACSRRPSVAHPCGNPLAGVAAPPFDREAGLGSGRSTILFQSIAALTSVEHNVYWYEAVDAKLKERLLANLEYILAVPT